MDTVIIGHTLGEEAYKEMLAQGFSMGFMSCIVNAGTAIFHDTVLTGREE